MKLSPQIYFGLKGNRGAQLTWAYKGGEIMNTPLTYFISFQRQEIFVEIDCNNTGGKKPCHESRGINHVFAEQDAMNTLMGLYWGRYKMGEKGNTTVSFRLEIGVHEVLSGKIKSETSPSLYKWQTSSPLIAITSDFTIW